MSDLDLAAIPAVDVHLHPPLRAAASPAEGDFRRLFTESDFPAQLPHVESSAVFLRAVATLGRLLGVEGADPAAVVAARHALGLDGWFGRCLQAGNVRGLLVDYGYSTGDQLDHAELSALAARDGARVWPVYRIETVLGAMLPETRTLDELVDRFRAELTTLRGRGYVALKSIVAYRTGLHLAPADRAEAARGYATARATSADGRPVRLAHKALLDHLLFHALEVAAQQELPFHLHTGFGDRDLWLPQTDPTLLRHVLEDERYRSVPFVLLHCYPFLRQGAYLAHVYPNVYIDLSLGVPLVGFGVERVYAEALELAPTSKVLYGSDAFSAPDLMLLGAVWARAALGAILERWVAHGLAPAPAERLAEAILHGNTLRLHGLAPGG